MFINRTYTRTAHDDFILNVLPFMDEFDGALEIRGEAGKLLGWLIRPYCE